MIPVYHWEIRSLLRTRVGRQAVDLVPMTPQWMPLRSVSNSISRVIWCAGIEPTELYAGNMECWPLALVALAVDAWQLAMAGELGDMLAEDYLKAVWDGAVAALAEKRRTEAERVG